jgi:hypothetical protein
MTHVIIFLHVAWKPRALSRVQGVESRGVGNVAKNSVDNTMIRLRVNNYQMQRALMTSVVKKKWVFQETLTVAVVTIHTVRRGGNKIVLFHEF